MGFWPRSSDSGIQQVLSCLSGFRSDPALPETKLRDALGEHLAEAGATPRRSAGIHGETQKVDLFFDHRDEDYCINIRSKLTDTKIKTVLGEILLLAGAISAADRPRKTHLVLLIADDGKNADRLQPGLALLAILVGQSGVAKALRLHLGVLAKDGVHMLPLTPS